MKKLLLLLALLIFTGSIQAEELPNVQLDIRDYNAIEIPSGTFIPVINTQEISTQNCSEGYKVRFIATNDMFLHDTNIIPRGTEFFGYIEKINAPVVGTNAAMKIKITKMLYKDGYEVPIRGYLYTSNDNIFGGELTPPAKLLRIAQRQVRVKKTTLQMRPGNVRQMGKHTIIESGSNEIIVLTAPAKITHTLTNWLYIDGKIK